MNKTPFNLSSRPAIDSSPSATRIGSNAQCKRIKLVSAGIKNESTNYRIMIEESNALEYARLTCPNHISLQDHPFIRPIDTSLIPLLVYRSSLNLLMKGSLIKSHF